MVAKAVVAEVDGGSMVVAVLVVMVMVMVMVVAEWW